jgi:hypothetical protein
MKKHLIALASSIALAGAAAPSAAGPFDNVTRAWTAQHSGVGGFLSEIVSFDSSTNSLWVSGVTGVDVLNASNGSLIQRIDTTGWGSVNSVAIKNGIAAFAIESSTKTNNGSVVLFNTSTRSLLAGTSVITVGALPDMLTFTADGSKILVANEGTPSTYGALLSTTAGTRVYGAAAVDPVGSVSVIDVASRSATTVSLAGALETGSFIRKNTGMNYEPEYLAVNQAGTKAYVTLQEANAMGVLNLQTLSFEKVVGLGVKDFSLPGNLIDPKNDSSIGLVSVAAKGFYMPDGIAAYETQGKTFLVMANEGDFREDDGDRTSSAGAIFGATGALSNLRVSNTDSSAGNLFAAGARSFSIRDADGNLVYDSGNILDAQAIARGIYDDGRSRDKGVEPEGVELMTLGGRTYAFVGLERTTSSALAVFDITDPANSSFVTLLTNAGDVSPEGLKGFSAGGQNFIAFSNEVSNTTTVMQLSAVPEPASLAMMLAGLGLVGVVAARRQRRA